VRHEVEGLRNLLALTCVRRGVHLIGDLAACLQERRVDGLDQAACLDGLVESVSEITHANSSGFRTTVVAHIGQKRNSGKANAIVDPHRGHQTVAPPLSRIQTSTVLTFGCAMP